MTVLAYNMPPNTTLVYGVIELSLTAPLTQEISLSDKILADGASKLGEGYYALSCYAGIYLQSFPSQTPTRYQSAAPKYNLGQFNLELGGFVVGEGFLNYLNQQIATIYLPINRSTYIEYGESPYEQPVSGAVEGLEYYAQYEISLQDIPNTRVADSILLNLTYTGPAELLIYYYMYGAVYADEDDVYVCVL